MSICNNQEKWESDKENQSYYKEKWITAVKTAQMESTENDYIDLIFVQMKDANKFAGVNRRKWKLSEYALIIFAAVVTALNTVAATITNTSVTSSLINVFAAIFAAIISIINGIKVLASYKETWLRHSKYRSALEIECHNFSTDSGDYEEIASSEDGEKEIAEKKIKKFKNNTTQLIQDDYDTFFANMRGSGQNN